MNILAGYGSGSESESGEGPETLQEKKTEKPSRSFAIPEGVRGWPAMCDD